MLAAPWLMTTAVVGAPEGGPGLRAETRAGWDAYIRLVEQRTTNDRAGAAAFLSVDRRGDEGAARRRVMAGGVVIESVEPAASAGTAVDVPYAMVHHWRGTAFVPGISAHALVDVLEREGPDTAQEDVLAVRVLERGPDRQRVFLQVRRSKVVTAVFNTEHDVRFARPAPDRATSRSTATRIREVDRHGEPGERELPPGDDRGFLWRWNAYWRYQDAPGGVIVECESVSLSRTVPAVVRFVAGPIIRGTATESLERTLLALRDRFASP